MSNIDKNKRIAKNTLVLYVRVFFVMLISLYTVRVVLDILGVRDYGIYDVVAGVVSTLSFISQTMAIATQRYYSYAIGEKNVEKLNQIFVTSILIYLFIIIVVVLLGETLGLWFLNNKMTIPSNRMFAANWIFQFALLSFVFSMLSIPYSAALMAHEDLSVYAYITIIDSIIKLCGAYLLFVLFGDKLILYGFLLCIGTAITSFLYVLCSRRKYSECRLYFYMDKSLFKSMLSFSSWNLLGTIASVANNQGNNILLNIFFGPLINGARAIAFQVTNVVNVFCSNFFLAIRPQLIKSYAEENYEYMMKLFYVSNKFIFYLLWMICLPLILKIDFILKIWLHDVTNYMIIFTKLSLIYALILSLHNPITAIIQASGNVKRYFGIVEPATLLSLPITFLLFHFKLGPHYTFIVSIIVFAFAHLLRLLVLHNVVRFFSIKEYFKKFLITAILVAFISALLTSFVNRFFTNNFVGFVMTTLTGEFEILVLMYVLGLNKEEKKMLQNYMKGYLVKWLNKNEKEN